MERRRERSRTERSGSGGRSGGGGRGYGKDADRGLRVFRKKVCRFCSDKSTVSVIDFKDTELISKFLTEKGKIIPRRITGNCSKHQRAMARAIKRTRHSALVAFQTE
ncbi:MAG: 30S ribosomal protein S18 [Candidatus Omnitrophica bacterium]|nr:30S ribosomal protein S18 [Candidatus Omnitrophota bacterium]